MPPPWLFWKGNLLTIIENKGSFMELRGTTILAVRHKGHVALIGDGQVTMGQSIVMKHTARKVRRTPLPCSNASTPTSNRPAAT